MGEHDKYGKAVMRCAAGAEFSQWADDVAVPYGPRCGATIDGVVGHSIAVEIESRVSKQVRGAVLDLICHKYPKKLLVIVPVHMSNPELCCDQCRDILARFVARENFRVVLLSGSGANASIEADAVRVRAALADLGWSSAA